MKPLLMVLVYLVLGGVLGGCASSSITSLPKQIPDTLRAACDLYTKGKPQILKVRAYITEHWNDKVPGTDRDLIPAEAKAWLTEANTYLPELDRAGLALCSAAEGVDVLQATLKAGGGDGKKIDWDKALSIVIKGADFALQMHAKGAI